MIGAMPHELFDSADGATLFAAMILFPVSISFYGGAWVVTTAWNKFKKSQEELREEIRNDALDFALKADKERRPGESLAQAIERLSGSKRS